jgi:hypothetical protein
MPLILLPCLSTVCTVGTVLYGESEIILYFLAGQMCLLTTLKMRELKAHAHFTSHLDATEPLCMFTLSCRSVTVPTNSC